MTDKLTYTVDESYEYLLKHLGTAENVAKTFIKTTIEQFQIMKGINGETGSPVLIIAEAAKELQWQMSFDIDEETDQIVGMSLGTSEYLQEIHQCLEEKNKIKND